MKKTVLFLFTILCCKMLFAQDITGQWNGVLKVQGMQLRLVFNISKSGDAYSATMDSPDQNAKGIPVTTTSFDAPKLHLAITNAGIEYNGELKGEEIAGTFKQGAFETALNLTKKAVEKPVVKRPQEPALPLPYYTEDVTFSNANANITLAGTLSLPQKEGNFPAVVLITGSGPQNRDEELLGHKPFLVIADYLTRHGIAVLRFDDRGVAKSTGNFKTATSADFATDVMSAVAFLKTRNEINKNKIGLIGHSEGGVIAPMVAAQSKDVNFIVLLAGTGIRGDKLLLLQQELIARADNTPETDIAKTKAINSKLFDLIQHSNNDDQLRSSMTAMIDETIKNDSSAEIPKNMTREAFVSKQVEQVTSPWMLYFLRYDPSVALKKVKCPVLAVNGSKDLQVPAKENLPAIKSALEMGGNKNITTIEFPGLNHLFQECKTGSPSEYAEIEQTFSPVALDAITTWISKQIK